MDTEQVAIQTLENLPIAAWAYDVRNDFTHVAWNHAMAELTGLPSARALGKTNYDLFDQATADAMIAMNHEVIEAREQVVIARETLTTQNGDHIDVRTVKVPVFDRAGEPTLLIGTCVPLEKV